MHKYNLCEGIKIPSQLTQAKYWKRWDHYLIFFFFFKKSFFHDNDLSQNKQEQKGKYTYIYIHTYIYIYIYVWPIVSVVSYCNYFDYQSSWPVIPP